MTYGHWIQTAHSHLEQAHREMRTGAASGPDDVLAALLLRGRVYRQMIRLTEMLLDLPQGEHTVDPRLVAAALADGRGPAGARMLRGMRAASTAPAALTDVRPQTVGRVGRQLAATAENLTAAADILASHVPPARPPVTPEGEAIRIGAGCLAALGDLGQLLQTQLLVDAATPSWLGNARADTPRWELLLTPVQWAATSRLADVAAAVIDDGVGQPPLLSALPPAAGPQPPQPWPVGDAHDVADRIIALCDWLYRNPGQVRVSHLRAGTQLGAALCLIRVPSASSHLGPAWTEAAITARHLQGSPSGPDGQRVVEEMRQLTAWLRDRPQWDGNPPTGVARAGLRRATSMLPLLATLLREGSRRAVSRGDVFTTVGQLTRRPGQLVWYAGGRTQIASRESRSVVTLGLALTKAAGARPAHRQTHGSEIARRGFLPLTARAASREAAPPTASTGAVRKPGRSR